MGSTWSSLVRRRTPASRRSCCARRLVSRRCSRRISAAAPAGHRPTGSPEAGPPSCGRDDRRSGSASRTARCGRSSPRGYSRGAERRTATWSSRPTSTVGMRPTQTRYLAKADGTVRELGDVLGTVQFIDGTPVLVAGNQLVEMPRAAVTLDSRGRRDRHVLLDRRRHPESGRGAGAGHGPLLPRGAAGDLGDAHAARPFAHHDSSRRRGRSRRRQRLDAGRRAGLARRWSSND